VPVPKLPLQMLGLLPAYHLWYWRRLARREPFVDDWNRAHGVIFVHIPKTAGTSVFKALGQEPGWDTHAPNIAYEQVYPELSRRCFRFAFVRNPWDRFASAFFFMKSGTNWSLQRDWARRHIGDSDFASFVRRLEQPLFRRIVLAERFFWPQSFWLAGASGPIAVDAIYRFEQLGEAIAALCERLDIPPPQQVPHLRKVEKPDYRALYDDETRRIVGRFYARDVEALGYGF
jgi:chondroitin 4-sulfotransferase 11